MKKGLRYIREQGKRLDGDVARDSLIKNRSRQPRRPPSVANASSIAQPLPAKSIARPMSISASTALAGDPT